MPTPTGSPTTFGGIGKLEFAPTSAPDDPNPVYVDITQYLRTEQTPLTITRGRQSELDTIQSSQLTAVLDNTDLRFMFGLTAGPYGANWAPAKKVRYSETIGGRTFVLFVGWIEYPDIPSWQPIGYQEVMLSCTDRLTRLGRQPQFVSTLGAHIMSQSADTLKLYYPLNDVTAPFTPAVGAGKVAVTNIVNINPSPILPAMLTTNAVTGPPGDDVMFPNFSPMFYNPPTPIAGCGAFISALAPIAVHINSGETVAISAWMRPLQQVPALVGGLQDSFFLALCSADATPPAFFGAKSLLFFDHLDSGGQVSYTGGGSLVSPRPFPREVWRLVTARLTVPTGEFALWVGADWTVTGTVTPTGVSDFAFLYFGSQYFGSLAHVQIHVGANAFPLAAHLAQQALGFTGLEYQTTGQRINTILDYAGVPGGERATDPGVSFMQRATLAGQTPEDALEIAVSTERGRGFTAGDGRYVFHDRTRIYNI